MAPFAPGRESNRLPPLPVDAALAELDAALRSHGSAVLSAPPGAGKTTRVPLALLPAEWLEGRRIVMLEPRRLAARAAASHMASLLGEAVGQRVGYRVRLDSRVGPATRIEVVTEGVLTRVIQADPALEGVGLVIFDEFHERSIHADLGLALTVESRNLLRHELRVLVMSATLETAPVAALLNKAPVVKAAGRMFEVETRYLDRPRQGRIEDAVASMVRKALTDHPGDVLAFLPGAGEIRRTADRLIDIGADVIPLFGNLSREDQDRAIAPSTPGRRKVVLATAIAETSLTIDGVRIVIDGGLMRVPRFSPRTGMSRLETIAVSRASADQRRGRAGRTAPGVCYRLWTRSEDAGLVERTAPEILSADLAPVALELAAWGARRPEELPWLDLPPASAWSQAIALLEDLNAVDAAGSITDLGRRMVALPVHPRLAHMLLHSRSKDHIRTASRIAALLGERDVIRADALLDPDIRMRLDALRNTNASFTSRFVIDHGAAHRVLEEARQLERSVPHTDRDRHDGQDGDAGPLLALAYPDRIAKRRDNGGGRFLLRNGRGVIVDASSPLASEEWLVIAAASGAGREPRVHLAAAITGKEVRELFGQRIVTEELVDWDAGSGAVQARRVERLGAIVLTEIELANADPDVVANVLAGAVLSDPDALPWTADSRALQQRIQFLRSLDDAWPDVSDSALAAQPELLEVWLAGMRSRREVRRLDLNAVLSARLDARQRRELERLAPSHYTVPSGSSIRIDYSDVASPVLAVRLQEVFGLEETPRIGGGQVPLLMHLLSPAHRPVQVTRDLASFWAHGYFEVRKALRGRYPKHDWPEDPATATLSRRPGRRR